MKANPEIETLNKVLLVEKRLQSEVLITTQKSWNSSLKPVGLAALHPL